MSRLGCVTIFTTFVFSQLYISFDVIYYETTNDVEGDAVKIFDPVLNSKSYVTDAGGREVS